MRVFVTGATGWVGSALVRDLIAAGHQVLGLARTEASAASLEAAGAAVHRGSLEDLDALRAGAASADAVAHTAFNHDFSRYAENSELDRCAIEAMGEALAGSDRPMLVTSETPYLASGAEATEADTFQPVPGPFTRLSETAVHAVAARGVRVSAVRMPLSVHGKGDRGFVPTLIEIARAKGVSAYLGDGMNRWPAAHRGDVARLFRLGLERGAAGGPYHASTEPGVPFKDIAAVIGRRLNLPVATLPPEDAAEHFGWFAIFAAMSVPASSKHTQNLLDWKPSYPGLLADMEGSSYFGK